MSTSQGLGQPLAGLRQVQIAVGALVAGCAIFLVIALAFAPAAAEQAAEDRPWLGWMAAALAVIGCLARAIVPGLIVANGRRKIAAEEPPDAGQDRPAGQHEDQRRLWPLFVSSQIVAGGILEGLVFFALIAYLVEASLLALILAIVLILGLAFQIPTRSRALHWLEYQRSRLLQERQLRSY